MRNSTSRLILTRRETVVYRMFGVAMLPIGLLIMGWVVIQLPTLSGILLGTGIFAFFFCGYESARKIIDISNARRVLLEMGVYDKLDACLPELVDKAVADLRWSIEYTDSKRCLIPVAIKGVHYLAKDADFLRTLTELFSQRTGVSEKDITARYAPKQYQRLSPLDEIEVELTLSDSVKI